MTSLLESLRNRKPSTTKQQPPKMASVVVETPNLTQQPSKQTKCGKCLNSEFWMPIGSTEPICLRCQPPSTSTLVAKQFFFDDWGNTWIAQVNLDGSESFIRETFEKGSPDVPA